MGVRQGHFSYYAYWVRQFFKRHPGRRRRELGRAEIEVFLGEMVGDERIRMWQVRQARNALEWYYELFRGVPLDEPSGETVRQGDVRECEQQNTSNSANC